MTGPLVAGQLGPAAGEEIGAREGLVLACDHRHWHLPPLVDGAGEHEGGDVLGGDLDVPEIRGFGLLALAPRQVRLGQQQPG